MMRIGRLFIPPTQLELHMKLYKIVVNSVPTWGEWYWGLVTSLGDNEDKQVEVRNTFYILFCYMFLHFDSMMAAPGQGNNSRLFVYSADYCAIKKNLPDDIF